MSYKAWTWNRDGVLAEYLEEIKGTRMAPKIRRLQRRARKLFERRRAAALIAEGCNDWDRHVMDSEVDDLFEDWWYDRAVSEFSESSARFVSARAMPAQVRDTSCPAQRDLDCEEDMCSIDERSDWSDYPSCYD